MSSVKRWLTVLVVAVSAFMVALDMTIVTIAIPQIEKAFGANLPAVQWIVTTYLLAMGAITPLSAFLANRIGIRKSYLVALGVFTAGSALAALAPTLGVLVGTQVVLALGGGPILTLTITYVLRAYPPEKRATAIAAVQVPALFAPMLGPVVGGLILGVASWRYVFLLNVPIGLAALVLGIIFLPEHPVDSRSRFDLLGFATVAPGFVALLFGLSQGATMGWGSPAILALLAVGVVLLTAFVFWELHLSRSNRTPLVDLRLFRLRSFWAGMIALVLLWCVLFWPQFIMPIYLESLRALSTAYSGLIMASMAVGTIIFALLGGRLADKIGPRVVTLGGVLVLAVASWLFSRITLETPLWQIALILGLRGISSGVTLQPLLAAAMMDISDRAEIAHGSTVTTMIRNVGPAVGTGLLVSLAQTWSGAFLKAASTGAAGQTTPLLRAQAQMTGIRDTFLFSVVIVVAAAAFIFLLRDRKEESARVSVGE